MFDDDTRLNLAAYILQANGIAAGPARLMLTAADALASQDQPTGARRHDPCD
jgi:hypothetical protein